MTGLLVAVALAGGVALLMVRLLRLPRIAWEAVGAVLVLGLAGYALAGRPDLSGSPTPAGRTRVAVDERAITLRQDMGGGFGPAFNWLIASDGAMRAGVPAAAVNYIRSGIRENPRSADLWLGLGNALVANAGNRLTPAAELAYARAAELDPRHPGPWFFRGLAEARAGDAAEARRLWQAALRRTPADADYRPVVVAALASLEAR